MPQLPPHPDRTTLVTPKKWLVDKHWSDWFRDLRSRLEDIAAQVVALAAQVQASYAEGNWTPVGNNIVLTTPVGRYTKNGRLVSCQARLVFPATADGSPATISGLPFTVTPSAARGGGVAFSSLGSGLYFLVASNTTTGSFFSLSGVGLTNAALSGVVVVLDFSYTV